MLKDKLQTLAINLNSNILFPHFFASPDTLNYEGAFPPAKFFLDQTDYVELVAQYSSGSPWPWNFRKESLKYLEGDFKAVFTV